VPQIVSVKCCVSIRVICGVFGEEVNTITTEDHRGNRRLVNVDLFDALH
jgi:hypothetical protein